MKRMFECQAAVQANGGTIVLPKQEIGQGMEWISAFKDPENNIIGLYQMAAAPPQKSASKKAARRPATKVKKATRRKRP